MVKFKGVYTALVTPFNKNEELSEEILRQHIRFQIENEVEGLVILGTTAETPTLENHEKKRIIEIALEEIAISNNEKKPKVIVGTGSYSTKATIESTKQAEDLGIDGCLIVTPYYNKPTQEGLYQHFKKVANSVKTPILIYNIAGRTGQNIQTETLKRLSEIENIYGVKEASGNILQMMDVYHQIILERDDFSLLSGDDALTLPLISLGGHGVVSVVSNLVPDLIKNLTDLCLEGDFSSARRLHYELLPLFKAAFIETNPIPIKALMDAFGMEAGPCRLPLCQLRDENISYLKNILSKYESCYHG